MRYYCLVLEILQLQCVFLTRLCAVRVRLDQGTSFGGLPSVQMMSMRFGLMLVREMSLFDSVLFILIQPDAPIKSGSAPTLGVDIFTTKKKDCYVSPPLKVLFMFNIHITYRSEL